MRDEKNFTSNFGNNNLYYSKATITLGTNRKTKVTKACSNDKVTYQVGEICSGP
jgi:hypothetical protein